MNPTLNDGTKLVNLSEEEKKTLEKDIAEVLEKNNAVLIPTLIKEVSAIIATISAYKKQKDEVNTDNKTEEGSTSDNAESAKK